MKKKMAAFALIFAAAASSMGILASAAEDDTYTLKTESFEIVSNEELAHIKDEPIEEPMALNEDEDAAVNIEDLASDVVDADKITYFTLESLERATTRINNWRIAPGELATSSNVYPMEAGEIVTINCSYTPFNASVDFGLITPSGNFRHANRTGGSINKEIQIYTAGTYRLAIRNNSNRTVSVSGYINY